MYFISIDAEVGPWYSAVKHHQAAAYRPRGLPVIAPVTFSICCIATTSFCFTFSWLIYCIFIQTSGQASVASKHTSFEIPELSCRFPSQGAGRCKTLRLNTAVNTPLCPSGRSTVGSGGPSAASRHRVSNIRQEWAAAVCRRPSFPPSYTSHRWLPQNMHRNLPVGSLGSQTSIKAGPDSSKWFTLLLFHQLYKHYAPWSIYRDTQLMHD